MFKLLLHAGADIDKKTITGCDSPLYTAVIHKRIEMVQLLLQAGANPNVQYGVVYQDTPLATAIKNGVDSITMSLLDCKDIDPNLPSGSYSYTPIYFAILYDNACVLLKLLALQPHVNIVNVACGNYLHFALNYSKTTQHAEILLQHGADPDARNARGWTPLHQAVFIGNVEKIQLLLQYKAGLFLENNENEDVFAILQGCLNRSANLSEDQKIALSEIKKILDAAWYSSIVDIAKKRISR
jgi:ankyrin repeat protein